MKKPHEYLSDAASVAGIYDQAHDSEAHWSRIAEAAVVLCQQDAQREIEALQEQLLLNAEALTQHMTRNGPPPRRLGELSRPSYPGGDYPPF
ncbi:hypothetical protein D0N36_06830 [Hymenobacter lapidiphilus]|uniref:hypothetical protein n=1 Tax=Hymenobacter sp. CCM 8763 TaxID=2303334 RepID=UPI000E34A23D|nr:hypothetical protein [Hymenobacter sp. CCM 8763]RFP65912.1 hypothetical protein D0N36_06830 [Hymenobacter sp. CCM 8763]